jgi:hypothetical protein
MTKFGGVVELIKATVTRTASNAEGPVEASRQDGEMPEGLRELLPHCPNEPVSMLSGDKDPENGGLVA